VHGKVRDTQEVAEGKLREAVRRAKAEVIANRYHFIK